MVGRDSGQGGLGEVVAQVEDRELRLHVGEQLEHEVVPSEGKGLQRGVGVGGEDHARSDLACLDRIDIGDGEAAGGHLGGGGLPCRLGAEEYEVAFEADLDVGGDVDPVESVGPCRRLDRQRTVCARDVGEIEEAHGRVEEVDGVDDDGAIGGLGIGADVAADEDRHVVAGHFGDDRGVVEALTAAERSGLAWI